MRRFRIFSALLILAVSSMLTTGIKAQTFQHGDVFCGTGCGIVKWFSSTGVLKGTLDNTAATTYTTGMAFDAAGDLYSTTFGSEAVYEFNTSGTLIGNPFASGLPNDPESIVIKADGSFLVGAACFCGAPAPIQPVSPTGILGAPVYADVELRGTDWVDIAADQHTIYYTSEGTHIKRYDLSGGQLSDFVDLSTTEGVSNAYALRILPGTGQVLVSYTFEDVLVNADGSIAQRYPATSMIGQSGGNPSLLFATNLDPDGTSFWTADLYTGDVFRIRLSDGAQLFTFNDGECSATGGLAIFGELHSCPQVLMNPQSDTVGCDSIEVTSTVNSDGRTTVQWQVSTDGGTTWTNIAGADSTTYIFPSMASDNGNEYRAVFTDTVSGDNCPNDTSATSVVYVGTHLITESPSSTLACQGFTATFTSAAIQNPVPTVQWYRSTNSGGTWTAISGATSSTYTTSNVTTSMTGYEYEAVYTYPCTTATTSPATLTVGTAPLVTSNPSPTTENVCAGTTASWSVSASGTPTPTPQWQVSTDQGNTWNNIPGANSTTLSFTTVSSESGDKYRCEFTNDCGSATSRNASLVVPYAPGTPTCPSSITARQGANALFNSTATGFPTPSVQWQVSTNGGGSWSNISGATANTLTLHSVTSGMNGYEYHAVFTNGCGTSTSCAATLTVD